MRVLLLAAFASLITVHAVRAQQRVERSTGVYARNGGSDQKSVEIPNSCRYVGHATSVTTANPQEEQRGGQGGKWDYKDWVDRFTDNSIYRVSIWCWAEDKPSFGKSRWIGVALTVTMDCY